MRHRHNGVFVRKARPRDYRDMAKVMRAADRVECMAMAGATPEEAMAMCEQNSKLAWAGFYDGKLVVLFGLGKTTILTKTGRPWLIATDELQAHSKAFLRRCRGYVAQMLTASPILENYVDARNTTSVAWLRWMGFRLEDAKPFGAMGRLFHRFTMEAR